MTTEDDIRDWGGTVRARLGLHTIDQAKRTPHSYTVKQRGETICVVCGLGKRASIHR